MLGHPNGMIQLGAAMRRNALRYADRAAFVAGAERLTWREAEAACDRLAYRLRDLGIGPRDHVAVFGNNVPTFVLTTYALFRIGAAAVILNASLRGPHLAKQLNHAEATAVITGDGLQQHVNALRKELTAQTYITWDAADRSDGVANLDAALKDTTTREPFPIAEVDPQDIGCMIFSSGTTGTPKGAINTYWNLFAKHVSLTLSQELTQTDVGMLVTPLCMGGTQLMSINPYVMLGMTGVVMSGFEAGEALRLIEAEKVSTMFCVPTMINAMVSHPDYAKRDLRSLKKLISAGSPLPHEVYVKVRDRGVGVLECYGTSETGGGVMISAEEKAANPGSVGRAMAGFEIDIFDDKDRPVKDGEVGEFVIRGDPVATGYYKQPEIERETYASGWFHTGDLGKRDSNGYLYLVDRKKDMVKSGGINVFPKDIEEVLYTIPAVAECAVVGLPHSHWGEAVAAFIVRKSGASLEEASVLDTLKKTLAGYQIPKAVMFVDELPKTIFGKLSKVKLREDHRSHFAGKGA